MTEAFKIILSDENVKAVFVNIFGGIVRCDLIADGIIGAVEEVSVSVPVVVRLEGNNAELECGKTGEKWSEYYCGNQPDGCCETCCCSSGSEIMSILIDKNTKVICQGFTGSRGLSTLNRRLRTAPKWSAV